MHGAKFISEADGRPRVCELDAGHEGACAGRLDPEVMAFAKKSAKRRHAQLEQEQRAARGSAVSSGSGQLSPPELAAALIAALRGAGRVSFRAALAKLQAHAGGEVFVGSIRVSAKEIRQIAFRLQRDGEAVVDGDSFELAA